MIGWSFPAQTKDLMNYSRDDLGDKTKVGASVPTTGEWRQVIHVDVERFAKDHRVVEINCAHTMSKKKGKNGCSRTQRAEGYYQCKLISQ